MESFVITGKAAQVFRLIELKMQKELERLKLLASPCPYEDILCYRGDKTCADLDCPVWLNVLDSCQKEIEAFLKYQEGNSDPRD